MEGLKASSLAHKVNGKLIGDDKDIKGIFNILKDAKKGDVVIRHWIDGTGIRMAALKGVSCIITQNPRGNAVKIADDMEMPLIVTDKIEFSNAMAIEWAIEKFAKYSRRVVVTGTNGKSTTSHMIYSILKEAGYNAYTNTDSKSEYNTLIDPMVAKQIAEFGSEIDAMVIEVSEVQGWLGKIMKDHAYIMTSAVDPDAVVITNVALDHIGLVNSIQETFNETSGAVKALKHGYVILNSDDALVKKMEEFAGQDVEVFFYGDKADIEFKDNGIYYDGDIFIEKEYLPFESHHFIQDTLAAIGASLTLDIDHEIIKKAISTYKPLNRRFTILNREPLLIDDFAHNPDGITATIKNVPITGSGKLYIVSAIRGSRGDSINEINARAIAEAIKDHGDINYELIITNSSDVVDDANIVKLDEKKIFIETLERNGIKYIFHERLRDALENLLKSSKEDDTILLIGAQGMDPASEILNELLEN